MIARPGGPRRSLAHGDSPTALGRNWVCFAKQAPHEHRLSRIWDFVLRISGRRPELGLFFSVLAAKVHKNTRKSVKKRESLQTIDLNM